MSWHIGLDIGTTNIKLSAFCAESGRCTEPVSVPTPRCYPYPDSENYELDAEALFDAVLNAMRALLHIIPAKQVRGIAVSSLGESGVLADKDLRPLGKSISWFDPRSQAQALALDERLGREHIYQITGQLSSNKFGITKLLWSRENNPDAFSVAHIWLPLNSYIISRFCGVAACDYSIAARTMAFDIQSLKWSDEILDATELNADFFPEVLPGGESVGIILPEIASALGLQKDVRICTGGHDHACAAVGASAISKGCVLDSMGTSEVAMLSIDSPKLSHALYEAEVNVYPHCSPSLYRALTSMQACGASINWFLESIGCEIANEAHNLGLKPAAHLQTVAAQAPNDALFNYYPFLRGTQNLPCSGGVFLGFKDQHGIPAFAKALLDGLCCEFIYLLKDASEQFSVLPSVITAVGGPAQSDYFLQRKADISGIPVSRSSVQEAASFGAALLAAIACKNTDFESAAAYSASKTDCFLPAKERCLDVLYADYVRRRHYIEECYR